MSPMVKLITERIGSETAHAHSRRYKVVNGVEPSVRN